jgi:hypothetical protein
MVAHNAAAGSLIAAARFLCLGAASFAKLPWTERGVSDVGDSPDVEGTPCGRITEFCPTTGTGAVQSCATPDNASAARSLDSSLATYNDATRIVFPSSDADSDGGEPDDRSAERPCLAALRQGLAPKIRAVRRRRAPQRRAAVMEVAVSAFPTEKSPLSAVADDDGDNGEFCLLSQVDCEVQYSDELSRVSGLQIDSSVGILTSIRRRLLFTIDADEAPGFTSGKKTACPRRKRSVVAPCVEKGQTSTSPCGLVADRAASDYCEWQQLRLRGSCRIDRRNQAMDDMARVVSEALGSLSGPLEVAADDFDIAFSIVTSQN